MEETLETNSTEVTTSECTSWYTLMVMSNFENRVKTLLQKQLEYEEGASDFFMRFLCHQRLLLK